MKQKILLRLVAILALVFAVAGCVQSVPVTVERVDITIPLDELSEKPAPDDWAVEPFLSYPAGIYRTESGQKLVAPTGTEIEMLSGSTLDIQSGTTSTFGGDLDVTGALDVDGATTVDAFTAAEIATLSGAVWGAGNWFTTGTLGTTGAITTTSGISATVNITSAEGLVADVISEFRSGQGVTIDSVVLKDGGVDLTGGPLTLQNDETIDNSTNGQIDIDIAGTDEYTMTAAAFFFQANELILDADGDTSFHVSVDDQIDIKINGADDFLFSANAFQVLSGSVIEVDTINEETADNGVVVEGVTFLDGGGDFTANITTTAAITAGAAIGAGSGFIGDTIDEMTVGSGITVDSVVILDGGVEATNNITTSGSLVSALFTAMEEVVAIAATDGGTINATGTNQPLTSSGSVGLSDITIKSAGTLLILHNESATTITITDTGIIMLGGDRAITQYDVLTLLSDGTNWLEISFNAN